MKYTNVKSIGFILAELQSLVDAWYNKQFSNKKKLSILDDKIISIDEKIKQLKMMKKLVSDFKKSVADESC